MLIWNKRNDIEKMRKKFVYNFNPSNNYDIKWDNLESQVKEYIKIHQTNGWENLFLNEIIDNATNPYKNILLVNTKENKPYDVSYENSAQSKNKNVKKNY
jgi:hypothetical protein